jgi:hypothetical protein
MDNKNMVHIYNGIYSAIKNETLSFVATCIELHDIILSELYQAKKDKYMFSLTCGG